jgi:hypothetical protein
MGDMGGAALGADSPMSDVSSMPPLVTAMGDAALGCRHGDASSTLVDPLSRAQQHFFYVCTLAD